MGHLRSSHCTNSLQPPPPPPQPQLLSPPLGISRPGIPPHHRAAALSLLGPAWRWTRTTNQSHRGSRRSRPSCYGFDGARAVAFLLRRCALGPGERVGTRVSLLTDAFDQAMALLKDCGTGVMNQHQVGRARARIDLAFRARRPRHCRPDSPDRVWRTDTAPLMQATPQQWRGPRDGWPQQPTRCNNLLCVAAVQGDPRSRAALTQPRAPGPVSQDSLPRLPIPPLEVSVGDFLRRRVLSPRPPAPTPPRGG